MAFLTEISHSTDAMRDDDKSERQLDRELQWRHRLPTTDCDQFQLIGKTNCCQASGCCLKPTTCVTQPADDLVEPSRPCPRRCEQSGDTIDWKCCRQAAGAGRLGCQHKTTTMIIDNMFDRTGARCERPLGLALTTCALLLLSAIARVGFALHLDVTNSKFLDSSCNSQALVITRSNAHQLLLMLKCDIAPLYDRYVAAYHRDESKEAISKLLMDGGEFVAFRENIEQFSQGAEKVLMLRELCSWKTFSELSDLKKFVQGSQLLSIAYDLVAIELHTSCIDKAISKLPEVPYLVKDIVKIYLYGANKPLPDLNAPAEEDMDSDTMFDVETAVKENGSLEDVVGLSLSMFGRRASNQETAQEFRATCKNFLISIEQCWDTMEIMNSMVSTDGSAIRQVNNYALRRLAPTKFADICSRISEQA